MAAHTFIDITWRQRISGLPLLLVALALFIVPLRSLDWLIHVVLALLGNIAHGLVAEVGAPVYGLLEPVQFRNDSINVLRVGHGQDAIHQVIYEDLPELLDPEGQVLSIDVFD